MNYLVWISDLVVTENYQDYDFLSEMYPEIRLSYNHICFLIEKADKPISEKNREKINILKTELNRKCQILGIKEYILFEKLNDKYIEPTSGIEFNLTSKSLHLRDASEEEVKRYYEELTEENKDFLIMAMKEFKDNISRHQNRKYR